MIGFYCFTLPEPVVELTLKEKIALLPADKKTTILDAFINKIPAAHLHYKIGIELSIVEAIYENISNIQEKAKSYMRDEVVEKEAILDSESKVITPAVMVKAPTTQTALGLLLQPLFAEVFTSAQVTAIITAMIKWCKFDGTGTFAFYSTNIKL